MKINIDDENIMRNILILILFSFVGFLEGWKTSLMILVISLIVGKIVHFIIKFYHKFIE